VLAVGDMSFQKKCLQKVQDVSRDGRTVLFVSHSMPAITRLCERAILLDGGRVLQDGDPYHVVKTYVNSGLGTRAAREWPDPASAPGDQVVRLRAVRVRADDGQTAEVADIRRPVQVEMEYDVVRPGHVLELHFRLYNEAGVYVFAAVDLDPAWRGRARPIGRYVSTAWIPGNLLSEGTLFVTAALTTQAPAIRQFEERDVVAFQIVDTLDGDSARGDTTGEWGGAVRPLLKWTTHFSPREEHCKTL
jgi:lipopolysaccharide transport system ATP-binding protein